MKLRGSGLGDGAWSLRDGLTVMLMQTLSLSLPSWESSRTALI